MAEQKIQQCLVIIKPDGLVKSLTGSIISALSETKLKIVGARILKVSKELAEKHYSELKANKIKQHGEEKGTLIFENTVNYIIGKFHMSKMLFVYAVCFNPQKANAFLSMLKNPKTPCALAQGS